MSDPGDALHDVVHATEAAYEVAEVEYLSALRQAADRTVMTSLAAKLSSPASEWNSAAYAAFFAFPSEALNDLTERTDVLAELWADVAAAYAG